MISPLTGGASSINVYGIFEQTGFIYRPNALTGDPNHLGIMLILPLLILTPLYLRLERGNPWKLRLGLTLAFLLVVEVLTLSRSGIGGLILGFVAARGPVPAPHLLAAGADPGRRSSPSASWR